MLLIWKNKGILVLLYLIVSFFITALLLGILHRNVGGVFSKVDFYTTVGLAFLFAGIWTYLTSEDYYIDKDGNKKKMDTVNEFFFIPMKVWAFIFFGLAAILLGNQLFGYFEPVNL